MPTANKYKIADILDAAKYYFDKTGRRYIFEYALIKGVNDGKENMLTLAKVLKGKPCHVNLIRLNYVKEKGLRGADDAEEMKKFWKKTAFRQRYAAPWAATSTARADNFAGDT